MGKTLSSDFNQIGNLKVLLEPYKVIWNLIPDLVASTIINTIVFSINGSVNAITDYCKSCLYNSHGCEIHHWKENWRENS